MQRFKYNKFLIGMIIIGLVAALVISWQRHQVEQANRQVDMAIDYEDLQALAQREGLPESYVLQQAKEAGITSLAVYETTFRKLNANGKASAVAGSDLLAAYHKGALTDPAWCVVWARIVSRSSTWAARKSWPSKPSITISSR